MRCGRRWKAHDEVLREAVEAHGGALFKHTGDGVCAAFASPRAAVDAAVAAQRALELPVRMGIATGEAELRGGDYFGPVLNRAARVMAAGHGGQILLDGATAGLLSGVELMDLGPRRLRDIAKPVDVFQVRAAGLRTEFPPLKTLDSTPGNLRPPTTSFVGREAELAELQTALEGAPVGDADRRRRGGQDATRVGGRRAVGDNFPDGVWVIELAPVGDPARGARGGGSRARDHPAAGDELWPTASRPHWRAGRGCWCSTTANTSSTPRRS